MKITALAVVLTAFSLVTHGSEKNSNNDKHYSITISPFFLLIAGLTEFTIEYNTNDYVGLALVGGIGSRMKELGVQYNRYIKNNFNTGVQVGIETIGLVVEKSNDSSVKKTDKTISVGAYVGYKVIARNGFTFNIQYGQQYVTELRKDEFIISLFNLNVGWSF